MTNYTFTMVDNRMMDCLCRLKLGNYESRVLFAIIRRTWGYHESNGRQKKFDWISESQISKMTGIDRRNVHKCMKSLTKRGLLTKIGREVGINPGFLPSNETANKDHGSPSHEMTTAISADNNLPSTDTHTINKIKNIKETNSRWWKEFAANKEKIGIAK